MVMTSVQRSSLTASPRARQRKKQRDIAPRSTPVRNTAESPVAWLYSRRDADGNTLITEAEFQAGERLRADFWFAQMTPSVTQSWSATASIGGQRGAPRPAADLRDSVIIAQDRVRRALAAVGPEHADVLVDVCCHLKGLEEVERREGWPRRSAKIVLTRALTALARHYGLGPRGEVGAGAIRHWGASDFRPQIDGGEDGAD